ncbi:MAG: PKD domain-containing protein [bacterium]|nr:PKD domain-containing protein [bacterium]
MRRSLGVFLALAFGLTSGCAPPESGGENRSGGRPVSQARRDASAFDAQASDQPTSDLGTGFLVWESNRSRNWRIWTRELAASTPTRLTPDEGTRQHCCAHISPDGRWIAYLSYPDAMAGYADGGSEGILHLIRPDGSGDRIVAERARSSWESRAAVWRSADELIYIRGDGSTVLHNLRDDRTEVLANDPSGKTWLINSRLSHATSGAADFSAYDRADRAIATRSTYGGCQPYFSHDGRWGFWAAGTGGPINRIDLLTYEVSRILSKSDARIPDGLGYAYFPMFSRDGRLFAFAASDYQHNHFLADYEIFVAESDPETLELLGNAVRMTSHPGTDRFPDVFLEPLDLGRHRGEAPFEVGFSSELGLTSVAWDFGDGTTATGPAVTHTFDRPGRYEVRATGSLDSQEILLRGQVVVKPATPPEPVRVLLREEGRAVIVQFDEEIRADRPKVRLESGVKVAKWSLGSERRSLVIELTEALDGFDRLHLEGIGDRAQRTNWTEPLTVEIEPPLWPSDRRGLAFLWETGEAHNLVWDSELESERSSSLEASGRAFLDHNFAMVLDGGIFIASAADVDSVLNACRKTNELSLEVVLRPERRTAGGFRKIISFSGGTPNSRNFVLAQRGDRLIFEPRAGNPFSKAFPEVELARIPAEQTSHVLISYEVGHLAAYLNGESILETESIHGGFHHWKRRPFLFGDGPGTGNIWRGSVEGVAVYNRVIDASEARENYLRYRKTMAARPTVPRLVVDATLLARSEAPSLEEISPYREALAVFEYRVDRVIAGASPGERIRVAHWSILDGDTLEINRSPMTEQSQRLTLEPFSDNRQLESTYLADSLEPGSDPLFYSTQR